MPTSLAIRAAMMRFGPVARNAAGLSSMTAMGQLTFVMALPLLSRLYTPADFGLFTVYLSIVNICGPVAALKFDSALYSAPSRNQARPILGLAIFTIFSLSVCAAALWAMFGDRLPGDLAPFSVALSLLTPVGVVLAGLWSTTSAWAVRCGAMSTLSIARLIQPATMTALQLMAGLTGRSAIALIVAHLLSHVLYSGLILARTLDRSDVRQIFAPSFSRLVQLARENRLFPLYVMPANFATQLVANIPPILLGSLFGAGIAGYCGMAYRLVFAPIVIVSLSLGHVFTSEVCRGAGKRALESLAVKIVLASLVVVCLPILIFGALSPSFLGLLLGAKWALTGRIAFAYAIFGAAQALATPFVEITSIYRFQALRLKVEARTGALVFAAIFLGFLAHCDALRTIWLMSLAGAAGTLLGLASVWTSLKAKLAHIEPHMTEASPAGPTP